MRPKDKTNVMRLLEQNGIEYKSFCYDGTGAVSGTDVAKILGENPEQVFKTLVTRGSSGTHYVFMVPVEKELDLKKAAKVAHEKSVEMIKSKELLPLTGYIHGGCSPIGMKKQFATFVEETAVLFDEIYFSAGKIGYQVKVRPDELKKFMSFEYADICE